jgi:ferredoxin
MTHVVTEACIRCRYTKCVDVCPTDAFRAGRNMLVISPDDCIDCAVCVPECPVKAIFFDADVPSTQRRFIPINAELSEDWPVITRSVTALPEADDWAAVKDKAGELDRRGPATTNTP